MPNVITGMARSQHSSRIYSYKITLTLPEQDCKYNENDEKFMKTMMAPF